MTTPAPGSNRNGRADQRQDYIVAQTNDSTAESADVPLHRPWARRPDAPEVERRFRRDQAGWRRRIACARRTSHDGRDLVAPYHGRWTR